MNKNYFFILLFSVLFLCSFDSFSQNDTHDDDLQKKQNIADLTIYPNPVTDDRTLIYMTSQRHLNKKVEFFNVLGKQLFSTVIIGNELDISNLSKGVYILRITENDITETRKLVIM